MFKEVKLGNKNEIRQVDELSKKSLSAYWLACHAALPLFFRLDWLFHLMSNFKNEIFNKTGLKLLYSDVSDVVQAPFTAQIGHEIYEFDDTIRDYLLYQLQQKFGEKYIERLSAFLYQYSTNTNLTSSEKDTHLATAWSIINQQQALIEISNAFNKAVEQNDEDEQIRLHYVLESMVSPFEQDSQENFKKIKEITEANKNKLIEEQTILHPEISINPPEHKHISVKIPKGLIKQSVKQSFDIEEYFKKILNIEITPIEFNKIGDKETTNAYSINENNKVIGLNLRGNNISDISFLADFAKLQRLYLGNNNVSDITPIGKLIHLERLGLNKNQISDISKLGKLTNLKRLYLKENTISDFTELNNLSQLTTLKLSNIGLETFPGIFELTRLEQLYLRGNQITEIPKEITKLKNLKALYLESNQITEIPEYLTELVNLEILEITYNKLRTIPRFITELPKLKRLETEGNQIVDPPVEIVEQGIEAIKSYFNYSEGTDYLYEANLFILGDPRAGKTTLARNIINPNATLPTEDETTRGIDNNTWHFTHNFAEKGKQKVKVNIWDFGGQTIYNQLHHLFMKPNSLYIILSDGRSETTDFKYWLHSTKIFGKDSPVVVFINEKEYRSFDVPFETFMKINKSLKAHTAVNLQDAAGNDSKRFNKAIELIKSQLVLLNHLGEAVPKLWKIIREELQKLEMDGIKVIQNQEFKNICAKYGITKNEEYTQISQYFHDLGVFMHFQNNDILRRFVFLDKRWVLNAVYKIIDSTEVINKSGILNHKTLTNFFSGEYENYQLEIIELLRTFNTLYRKDDFYVIPQHLPKEAPEYEWNEQENLQFIYDYDDYMPAGILWQFMVEMKDRIKNDTVWRYGVVLDFEGTLAEVKEEYGKDRIKIRVQGIDRSDVRAVVLEKIDEINQKYDELSVNLKVPCICSECNNKTEPHFYNYFELKGRQAKDKPTVECAISFENVSVEKLLSGVELPHTTYIITLIAKGKTELAIKELLAGTEASGQNDLYNKIIVISGNYHSAKNSRLKNIIDEVDFAQAKAKANNALINYLKEYVPKPDFEFDAISDEEPWIISAKKTIKQLLSDAKWDYENKKVTLFGEKEEVFYSLKELKEHIYDEAYNAASAEMPGDKEYREMAEEQLDIDIWIREELKENYYQEIETIGWINDL